MKKSIRTTLIMLLCPVLILFWWACGGATSPTVTSTTATGKVFTTGSISVTFSGSMDEASVESALSIAGSDPVAGTFAWADNTVTFTPDALWKTHHQYTMTITTAAKNTTGAPLEADYTQTFTPQINLHDVNGDGIDDFMASSPFHDFSPTVLNAGQAYLFLGKTDLADVDLATQTADATVSAEDGSFALAFDAKVVGDINGDGYADMMMSTPFADAPGNTANGYLFLIYGSASPANITISMATLDVVDGGVVGPADNTRCGWPIMPVGDVNGDGLADVVFGGTLPAADSQFWLVLGQTDPWPKLSTFSPVTDISDATYSVTGTAIYMGMAGYPVAACDVNGDEFDDIILGSPTAAGGGTSRGQAYVVAGSATPSDLDLRTQAASETLTGAADSSLFGGSVACGDVNGDGYDDLLIGSPGIDSNKGRAYLVAGGATFTDYDFSVNSATATYTGAAAGDRIGTPSCIPGDVNGDGFDDMFVTYPGMTVDGTQFRGRGYLFLGAASPASVDLGAGGTADATYTGAEPSPGDPYLLGYCKPIGDVNADGIDDLFMGAPLAPVGGTERGQAFVIFGSTADPSSIDFTSGSADVTITGAEDQDMLLVSPATL